MPFSFYLSCVAIMIFGAFAWAFRRDGWGLPVCMVLGTVSVWYVGDVIYNDYELYVAMLGEESLTSAFWQVLWFVVAFGALVQPVHWMINGRLQGQRSHVIAYLETNRLRRTDVQNRVDRLGMAMLLSWVALMVIAVIRVRGDVIGLFAPYLGVKADPWSRGQIGSGFSALLSFAGYLQIFLAAAFGVLAAVAIRPQTRNMALLVCFLTLPYFIFDRTRNTMLATVLPGVLAFVFFRVRGGMVVKGAVLLAAFAVVNFWFSTVMANRSGMRFDIGNALSGGGETKEARHEGLNMLEELAWIDYFTETGAYVPNRGERYFAELVNPIPRALWLGKPMIGLDYAVARGQMAVGPSGETTATISTGMIGQGVVNFGRVFGPLAAATLMALWVALLARQDLLGSNPGRLILYGCGLILTFNMGRDITLLVIYPFLFGLGLFWLWQYYLRSRKPAEPTVLPRNVRRRKKTSRVIGSNLPKVVRPHESSSATDVSGGPDRTSHSHGPG